MKLQLLQRKHQMEKQSSKMVSCYSILKIALNVYAPADLLGDSAMVSDMSTEPTEYTSSTPSEFLRNDNGVNRVISKKSAKPSKKCYNSFDINA